MITEEHFHILWTELKKILKLGKLRNLMETMKKQGTENCEFEDDDASDDLVFFLKFRGIY